MTLTQLRHDAHAGLGPGSATNLMLYPLASYGDAESCSVQPGAPPAARASAP